MPAYTVFWREQRDSDNPIVVADSYGAALKLAYEEIEVSLSEIKNPTQCPRCDTIFENLKPNDACPTCEDEVVEAL